MKKLKYYFLLIPFTFQSCGLFMEHPTPKITQLEDLKIINNSDFSICYLFSNQNPDTSLFTSFPFSNMEKWTINKKFQITLKPAEYASNDFNNKAPVNNYQYLFLFSKTILETTPWDSIRDKYLILKRYNLTLEYLQENNWTITYP